MTKNKNNLAIWNSRMKKKGSTFFQKIGSSIDVDKRLYKEDIMNTEMTEQEIAWSNEVSLIFDEAFEREQGIIKIMKIIGEIFTLESFSNNENALNDLLVNFQEIEYYFTLREELAKKEANVLQKLQEINK